MSEVVRQLSERLVSLGHEVMVATSADPGRHEAHLHGVRVAQFAVSGNAVSGFTGEVAAYQDFLTRSDFDVVTNFAAQQWATDLALPLLTRISGRKVFVPTGFSALHSRRYRDYYRELPGYMKLYDMNVFLSDSYRDVAFSRRHGIRRETLIPNGASADEFLAPLPDLSPALGVAGDELMILHVGSHTWFKGHEEAMEIFRRAEISDATLLLVGCAPAGGCGALCLARAQRLNASAEFARSGKRILVRELSRAETVAAYRRADLFLFPSNIECSPIVLFECMASKTPFLTTDVGNSAEIIGWSGGAGVLLPSDTPSFLPRYGTLPARIREKIRILLGRADDFSAVRSDLRGSAERLTALCRDPGRRLEMAQAGFDAWQKSFTWEGIARQYETLYLGLAGGGK